MPQMRLGWWRDREGRNHKVEYKCYSGDWPWESSNSGRCWRDDGSWDVHRVEHPYDLIEFLRPLEDLPPALNSAVKAAEDRVRELKQMVDETQTAWATACRLHEAAQKELERMEKECEVRK